MKLGVFFVTLGFLAISNFVVSLWLFGFTIAPVFRLTIFGGLGIYGIVRIKEARKVKCQK